MRMGYRRLIILALAALLLGGLAIVPAALAADEAHILGQVQGTGYKFTTNLSGANVEVWTTTIIPPAPFSATTDVTGWYVVNTDGELPLYYTSSIVGQAKATYYQDSAVTPIPGVIPNAVVLQTFQLQVNPTTFTGKVTKKGTSKGVKGVKVSCAGLFVKTNSKGKYTLPNLLLKPGQKYSVVCTKKGYRKTIKKGLANPGLTRTVNIAMRKK